MTQKQLADLGAELDQIRADAIESVDDTDKRYIKRVVRCKQFLEIAGRCMIHFSFTPIGVGFGAVILSVSKTLDNMEIGHNVLHGQYDWMDDSNINSKKYELDFLVDSRSWKKTHNREHHNYTNIIGKDRDYGYATLRLSQDIPWSFKWRFNLLYLFILSLFFQWGVGLHEMEIEKVRAGKTTYKKKWPVMKAFLRKGFKQLLKDYVIFPLISWPFYWKIIIGNLIANALRNVWVSSTIFCGHLSENVETFTESECEKETRGQWYYRQLLGSSNFKCCKLIHILSGHLGFQIEHHLFPSVPSRRYPEIAPKVESVCKKYGLKYNTGSLAMQYCSVLKKVWHHSKPI